MTTPIIDKQVRKTGDTLRLSGQLTGGTVPTDLAAWIGAVAVLNITHAVTGAVYRVDEPASLNASAIPVRYLYEGAPPVLGDVGNYEYEVEVTFADTTTTTFPCTDAYKFKLKIIAELG